MVKIHGKAAESARLESITWRKPALIEITLSQYEEPGKEAAMPNLADFTDFKATHVGSKLEVHEGVRRRFFIYRMAKNIPMSPTERNRQNYQEQWGVNTVLNQQEIQQHPKFPLIKKKYNGSVVNEVVVWPRYIQDPESKDKKVIKNPMFGVRGFLAPEVEVSVEIGYSEFPMDFTQINEVGYIDQPLGFGFFAVSDPTGGGNADWILTDKSFQVAGMDRIEKKSWRSQWGGWPRAVYSGGIQGANYA
jgi:hypothetical protein